MNPGDLVGFETSGPFAALIRFGQRLAHVRNSTITHIAVITQVLSDGDAKIIQSVRRVDEVLLSSYGPVPHVLIPSPLLPGDARRSDGVAFAQANLGRKYGVLSVISRGLNCLTPKAIQIGACRKGDMDCATLGVRVLEDEGV